MTMQQTEIHLTGKLICTSDQDAEIVRRHLPEHIRLTRQEAGCRSFDVSATDDPLVWRVAECFADQAAFEFHQLRTGASDWWQATAHIKREFEVTGLA